MNIYTQDFEHARAVNLFKLILYPFKKSSNIDVCYGLYFPDFDIRYAINNLISFVLLFGILLNKIKISVLKNKDKLLFLLFFVLISYYINIFLFGNYRYIVATSFLYGLIIFLALSIFLKNYRKSVFFSLILLVLVYSFQNVHVLFYKKPNKLIFFQEHVNIEDNAYVFLNRETSYFITNSNKKAKYIAYVFPKNIYNEISKSPVADSKIAFKANFYYSSVLEQKIKKIILEKENIYIIAQKKDLTNYKNYFEQSISQYSNNLKTLQECRLLKVNFHNQVFICKIKEVYNAK